MLIGNAEISSSYANDTTSTSNEAGQGKDSIKKPTKTPEYSYASKEKRVGIGRDLPYNVQEEFHDAAKERLNRLHPGWVKEDKERKGNPGNNKNGKRPARGEKYTHSGPQPEVSEEDIKTQRDNLNHVEPMMRDVPDDMQAFRDNLKAQRSKLKSVEPSEQSTFPDNISPKERLNHQNIEATQDPSELKKHYQRLDSWNRKN